MPSSAGNPENVGLSLIGALGFLYPAQPMVPPVKPPDFDGPGWELPQGHQRLPSQLVSPSQRGRLLAGALQEVTEHGYPATTVAQIIAAAGVSRKTFYEHFANKQDCVFAAYDLIVEWLGEQIAAALAGVESWSQAVRIAVRTTLACLDADLRIANLCAVEILRVDRVGLVRYQASVERLAIPLRAGRARCAWGTELPLSLEETVIGGAIWLIGHRSRLDHPRLDELAPDITYFLLAPYLDIPEAQRVVAGIS
jgi:AcrR family transcriptional regulator